MEYQGVLTKMQTEFGTPIQYYLNFDENFIHLNALLTHKIQIDFLGFQCLHCGKKKKIFRQGFCFDCATQSASAGDWIMKPELSKAHLGIEDRDLAYEMKVQLQPHVVYLAFSSEIKVGVTRNTQIPTRWIDQGAAAALPIVELPNRYLAGITEVALKSYYVDKTHWRKMLQPQLPTQDLMQERATLLDKLPPETQPFFDNYQPELCELNYPVLQYPSKIQSLNLNHTPSFSGKLMGIKGQYLIFEDGTVFNIRTYEGFVVRISIQ